MYSCVGISRRMEGFDPKENSAVVVGGGISNFQGVTKQKNKWTAAIRLGRGDVVYLGVFKDSAEAAHVYDSAAFHLHKA